jgi:hypothetical protein
MPRCDSFDGIALVPRQNAPFRRMAAASVVPGAVDTNLLDISSADESGAASASRPGTTVFFQHLII